MSERSMKKEVDVTICDYCDKEVRELNSSEDWVYITRGLQLHHQPTGKEKWLKFIWPSKVTFSAIRYDFHSDCFDKMVKEMIERKPHPQPNKEIL